MIGEPNGQDITDAHAAMLLEEVLRSDGEMGCQPGSHWKVSPGRLSEKTSADSIDADTKEIRVMVPPCLAGTDAGCELASRILLDNWEFQLRSELDDALLRPTPPETMKSMERTLIKANRSRKCVVCQTATRSKRRGCEDVYYCGTPRRKAHWPKNCLERKVRAVAIEEHIGIAVPDYRCLWHYQHAISLRANSAMYIGMTIMSRERVAEMFGDKATKRTILRLALTSKPSLYLTEVFGAAK